MKAPPRILITGASRGLGRSLALAFAAEGAEVVGTGRDEAALAETAALCAGLPGEFDGRRLEVQDSAAVDALVGSLGDLDVCVANAGIAEIRPLAETDPAHVRRLLEVNVVGAFAVMRAAAAAMLRRGEGQIVPIASDAAYRGIPGMSGYVASKHALLGLARSMAEELSGTGVHVRTVFPGPVRTEILGEPYPVGGMEPDEVASAIAALVAAGPSIGPCELHLLPSRPIG